MGQKECKEKISHAERDKMQHCPFVKDQELGNDAYPKLRQKSRIQNSNPFESNLEPPPQSHVKKRKKKAKKSGKDPPPARSSDRTRRGPNPSVLPSAIHKAAHNADKIPQYAALLAHDTAERDRHTDSHYPHFNLSFEGGNVLRGHAKTENTNNYASLKKPYIKHGKMDSIAKTRTFTQKRTNPTNKIFRR